MTTTVIALGIILALAMMIWGAINAERRNSVNRTRMESQIKDMQHAAQIRQAAADARAVVDDEPVDQRLRDIGGLRRD